MERNSIFKERAVLVEGMNTQLLKQIDEIPARRTGALEGSLWDKLDLLEGNGCYPRGSIA